MDFFQTLKHISSLPRGPGMVLRAGKLKSTEIQPRPAEHLDFASPKEEGASIAATATAKAERCPGGRWTRPPGVRGGVGCKRTRVDGREN